MVVLFASRDSPQAFPRGGFAVPALARRRFGLNEVFAFWFAYVMTRPFGASFADWFGRPYLGGLGLGDTRVSSVLTIFIIGFVVYLSVSRKDVKEEQPVLVPRGGASIR